MKKNGSMQLSINAIVILVMAIAILGLGLGIIRGIGDRSDQFLDFPVDLTERADRSKPVANIRDSYDWRIGSENELGISFYNQDTGICNDEDHGARIRVNCGDSPVSFDYIQLAMPVAQGSAETLRAYVIPDDSTEPGRYACRISAVCGENQQTVASRQTFIRLN